MPGEYYADIRELIAKILIAKQSLVPLLFVQKSQRSIKFQFKNVSDHIMQNDQTKLA